MLHYALPVMVSLLDYSLNPGGHCFEPLGFKNISSQVNSINQQLLTEKQNSFIMKIRQIISDI